MNKGNKKIKVTRYSLNATHIIIEGTQNGVPFEKPVSRRVYELWLTDGTDTVDMSISHHADNIIEEVPIKLAIDDYWLQGQELDNTPILEHLQWFLLCDEGRSPAINYATAI